MNFGYRIRQLRTDRNEKITLKALSKATGLSIPYLSNIERNLLPPPKAEKIKLIAETLGGDTEELLSLANRLDSEELDKIKQNQKGSFGEKAVKFLTSAMNLDDEDSLGGFTGIFQIVTGEGVLNPDAKLGGNRFKTLNFLMELYSKTPDDGINHKEVEIRREVGKLMLELIGSAPYASADAEVQVAIQEELIEIFKKYPKELCEEVIKNEQLRDLYIQSLEEEREEEADAKD